jgi:hypothetical protein
MEASLKSCGIASGTNGAIEELQVSAHLLKLGYDRKDLHEFSVNHPRPSRVNIVPLH